MGYLTGCDNSLSALDFYRDRVASYQIFEEHFSAFPAHLHINCLPEYQGIGIGKKLMERFFCDLSARQVRGVHIITSGEARNIGFYHRLEFDFVAEKDFCGSRLRFMGKLLLKQ